MEGAPSHRWRPGAPPGAGATKGPYPGATVMEDHVTEDDATLGLPRDISDRPGNGRIKPHAGRKTGVAPVDTASAPISTGEAARRLGLKRQQFQVLARFFGLEPVARRRFSTARTPANLYDPAEIEALGWFSKLCRLRGIEAVLDLLPDRAT